jgi:hypothetical protein
MSTRKEARDMEQWSVKKKSFIYHLEHVIHVFCFDVRVMLTLHNLYWSDSKLSRVIFSYLKGGH